jgi:mannose-6-phosphate isomerase-like protein (cupin superfamily)
VVAPYTRKNLGEVEDAAAQFGFGETHESRFPRDDDLGARQTGLSLHRFKPGKRQPFGHRHDDVEEIYVVLAGSGRVKLDDDVVELERLDAIRVAPGVMRAFEAGDEGLEILAFSPRREDDRGEIVPGWWSD